MSPPKVLREYHHFLEICQLCKKDPIAFGRYKIPVCVLQFLFIFPLVTFIPYLIWFCFEKDFDLKAIAAATNLILGSIQIIMIYCSLAMNNSTIIATVEDFQRIVDQSLLLMIFSIFFLH